MVFNHPFFLALFLSNYFYADFDKCYKNKCVIYFFIYVLMMS